MSSSKELKVVFGDINKNNYQQLKQLNNLSFPGDISTRLLFTNSRKLRYGRFTYYNDIIVGGITWKYDYF